MKNIILDFGAVLLDWNPHYVFDAYFGSAEKADWFLKNICTGQWNAQMDAGKPFAEGVRELTALYPEWAEAIALYQKDWLKMIGEETPGMYELECELKARGYGLYGLTNWSMETFPLVWDRRIFTILDGRVVSGAEGVVKPDPAIYRLLLERYSLTPGDCLFVDDNIANVLGARAVGIPAVQFTGAEDLRKILAL